MKQAQWNKSTILPLLLLAAAVVILSITVLIHQSLREDESQSLWQVNHSIPEILIVVARQGHVPLYHLILHLWFLVFGSGVTTGRVLSLLFFLASIPAMYLLARRILGSDGYAIFATALFAVSPFMNWYGNEIRMYALLALLTILGHYFFLGIFQPQARAPWLEYSLVCLLGILTHYAFLLILLVHALYLTMYHRLFPPGSVQRFSLLAASCLIIIGSWRFLIHVGMPLSVSPLLQPPTTVNILNTFSELIFGFQVDPINTAIISLWPLTVLFALFALRRGKAVPPEIVLLFLSILLPIAIGFLFSRWVIPLFLSRYFISAVPALLIFVSWTISIYPRQLGKSIAIGCAVATLAALTIEVASPWTPAKEDYRTATRYLEQNATPRDVVIASAPFTIYPVEYYYRGKAPVMTLPIWHRTAGPIPPFDARTMPQEVAQLTQGRDRVFLLLSYDQGYQSKIKSYFDSNFDPAQALHLSSKLDLFVYRTR